MGNLCCADKRPVITSGTDHKQSELLKKEVSFGTITIGEDEQNEDSFIDKYKYKNLF